MPAPSRDGASSALRRSARRHLWRHFAPPGDDDETPIFVRGEGCYLWDVDGRRYLDALSSLFCVNVGHGRAELAEAAAVQARELAYATTWDTAHPRAIELAERIAHLAPADLNRVFFTSGGSESVESALKLARSYHRLQGECSRVKVIARELAYHGTTFGALSATGLPSARTPFEPMMAGGCHVPHTDSYRAPAGSDPLWAADAIEGRIAFEGPETVAAVILEPVQNSGGCLPPPPGYFARVREICDRHGVLLISDDTICSWGRLGTWFGAQRFDYVPDIVTTAKGLTSAYIPMGAMLVTDRVAEPFLATGAAFAHGLTFGGIPSRPPSRSPTSICSSGRTSSGMCAAASRISAPRSTRSTTSRSWATCAAPGTSGGSSWSPTSAPAARSPPRRRTSSPTASWGRSCDAAG